MVEIRFCWFVFTCVFGWLIVFGFCMLICVLLNVCDDLVVMDVCYGVLVIGVWRVLFVGLSGFWCWLFVSLCGLVYYLVFCELWFGLRWVCWFWNVGDVVMWFSCSLVACGFV